MSCAALQYQGPSCWNQALGTGHLHPRGQKENLSFGTTGFGNICPFTKLGLLGYPLFLAHNLKIIINYTDLCCSWQSLACCLALTSLLCFSKKSQKSTQKASSEGLRAQLTSKKQWTTPVSSLKKKTLSSDETTSCVFLSPAFFSHFFSCGGLRPGLGQLPTCCVLPVHRNLPTTPALFLEAPSPTGKKKDWCAHLRYVWIAKSLGFHLTALHTTGWGHCDKQLLTSRAEWGMAGCQELGLAADFQPQVTWLPSESKNLSLFMSLQRWCLFWGSLNFSNSSI